MELSALISELSAAGRRFALAVGTEANRLVAEIAANHGADVVSVGKMLAAGDAPPEDIPGAIGQGGLLVDLDILFAPQLHLDPLDLLRNITRRPSVLVAAWPGWIEGDEAFYSEPGRRDYYRRRLENVLVLRPRPAILPGLLDFDVERVQ